MTYKILIALFSAFFLFKDFKRTGNMFLKAKIFHFIISILIVVIHSESIYGILNLLIDFKSVYESWILGLDKFECILNIINNIVYLLFSLLMFLYGIGLVNRVEKIRKYFINFILYFIPITTITIYILSVRNNEKSPILFLFIGFILSFMIYGLISYLYRQKFMIEFFDYKSTSN